MSTAIGKAYDFSFSRPSLESLEHGHAQAVIRYVCPDNHLTHGKILTRSEASRYRDHGIDLVTNFEWYANRCREGRTAGRVDAGTALAAHHAAGGPDHAAVYYSADFDAQRGDLDAIGAYFEGAAAESGLERVGAYGEYDVIRWLLDQELITFGWQTYAWSHGLYDEDAVLAQDRNGIRLSDGSEVDLDTIHAAEYGQWGGKGGKPSHHGGHPHPPRKGGAVYVVQHGDTLSAIAGRYGTSVAAIVHANHIPNADLIYPGQRVRIPGASTSSRPHRTYTVRRGDTLSAIAGRHHMTWRALYRANRGRISDPDTIYPGQTLTIP